MNANQIFDCFYTFGETAGLSSEIVEEAVAPFQFQKLVRYDALKSGSHQGTWSQSLWHGSDKQVDVVNRFVQFWKFIHNLLSINSYNLC